MAPSRALVSMSAFRLNHGLEMSSISMVIAVSKISAIRISASVKPRCFFKDFCRLNKANPLVTPNGGYVCIATERNIIAPWNLRSDNGSKGDHP